MRASEIPVVDDEPGVRLLLAHCFEDEGYSVTRAADGEQALSACEQALPDLMVLDLNMPGMSGFRVLEAMEQRGWRRFPVLVVSGHYGAARKLTGTVDAIMTKPVSLEEFCLQVMRLLEAREPARLRSE